MKHDIQYVQLMTNKQEISVGVQWDYIGVPGQKFSGWSKDTECMMEGGRRLSKGDNLCLLCLPYTPPRKMP